MYSNITIHKKNVRLNKKKKIILNSLTRINQASIEVLVEKKTYRSKSIEI